MEFRRKLLRAIRYLVIYFILVAIIDYFSVVIWLGIWQSMRPRLLIRAWINVPFFLMRIGFNYRFQPIVFWRYILILLVVPIIFLLCYFRKSIYVWLKRKKEFYKSNTKKSRIEKLEQEIKELKQLKEKER